MRTLLAAIVMTAAATSAYAAPPESCPVKDRDPCATVTRAVDCAVKLQPPCIYTR